MRRNLRLDWRALALLGALLSIIIEWPALVYAMPTLIPPAAAAVNATAAAASINVAALTTIDSLNLARFENLQHSANSTPTEHNEFMGYKRPPNLQAVTEPSEALNETTTELSLITSQFTTESSLHIPSTLLPTLLAVNDADAAANRTKTQKAHSSSFKPFKFSSSHHIAVLSRTERSIRSSSAALSSTLEHKQTAAGGRAAGGIVRRSPNTNDGVGSKSKRLNNPRNPHNNHHKSNLDRNERSTVSHLSGPSRKIQLYIKNRFIQLLPDGVVNGTQDDQSEYSEYRFIFNLLYFPKLFWKINFN